MTRKAATEVFIGVLAIVSIILLAIESLVSVSEDTLIGIYIADLIICVVFGVEFIQRLRGSRSKSRFLKTNGFEILAMIPAIGIYALGTIPMIAVAFRSLRLIRVVRVILLLARMRRVMSRSSRFVQRSNLFAMLSITVIIVFIGAFAALVLDSGTPNTQITNFSDAVWWSISTVTTVGYGDIVPRSIAGRIMGMFLMIIGIGVMAAFISQVSATLVESRIKRNLEKGDFRSAVISEIKSRLDNIDKLTESEVSLLIQTIQTLRGQSKNNG